MPPLAIRVQVAERQFAAMYRNGWAPYSLLKKDWSLTRSLQWLLFSLFRDQDAAKNADSIPVKPHALDHDPALILRPYNPRVKDVAARYTPHAHDPDALVYREKSDHQQKTTGRKPGAERTITTKGSDAHLAAKFRRLEGKNKPKRKIKIPSRKMQSRSSFR